jgi:hypothetical protein
MRCREHPQRKVQGEKHMSTYKITCAVPDEDDVVLYVSAIDAETATDYAAQNELAGLEDAIITDVEEVA